MTIYPTKKFRISEGQNGFTVQRKFIKVKWRRYGFLGLKSKRIKTKKWYKVNEDALIPNFYNDYFFTPPMSPFKTKEEAKKWIDDFFKYPINHKYN